MGEASVMTGYAADSRSGTSTGSTAGLLFSPYR
jgi:hypothetical protein